MLARAACSVVTAMLALVLASCGSTLSSTPSATPIVRAPSSEPSYSGPGWILGYPAFESLASEPSSAAIFDNPRTFVIVTAREINALAGWKCTPVLEFKSYASMQRAFANGGIPTGVRTIMYDNEHWSYTPINEQRNPAMYEQMAAALIHSHGLEYLATPAADLAGYLMHLGGSQYQSYLSLDLAGQAARYADILNIQAQGEEGSPSAYATFLASAIAQARKANPKIVIYAGISTARSSDPNAMFNAVQATKSDVSGYWLNVITSGGAGAVTLAQSFVNSLVAKLHAT